MKDILQRVIKTAAYVAAGVVIFLAVAVGLFRLLLPRLPEYQDEIKVWASSAIGLDVEFSGMDARWGLSGPELKFYNAELLAPEAMTRIVAAGEVSIGVGLIRLIVDRKLVVDQIVVRDTTLEIRQDNSGVWWIQGTPAGALLPARVTPGGLGRVEVIGQDVTVQLLRPRDERPREFRIPRILARRSQERLTVDATINLPEELGDQVTVAATRLLRGGNNLARWDLILEAEDLLLGGWSDLLPTVTGELRGGRGDIDASFAYVDSSIETATAELDLADIIVADAPSAAVRGRLDFRNDDEGWLIAADRLRITTSAGLWPETSLHVETGTDADGRIIMLDARASYLNLNDYRLLMPWLESTVRSRLSGVNPSGVIRNFSATVSDLDTETPTFDVSAEFTDAGIAAEGRRPGVRGFSGTLRADRGGGRLEIRSTDLRVSAPEFLRSTVLLDDASGTVIWRRGDEGITMLSDSIVLRNSILDTVSNVEVSIKPDSAPVVDFISTVAVNDVAAATRYVPLKPTKEKLRNWFDTALQRGRIPNATVRLKGPIDRFPFDDGSGEFRVDASVRDVLMKYRPEWPVTELIAAEVVFDGSRLLSRENRSQSLGLDVVDARIEIADVRDPHLSIDAYATGTLEEMRRFAIQSPIGDALGGQLQRVRVDGDATVALDLDVPIRRWRTFTFSARVQSAGGEIAVAGLKPPLTDLSGAVTIRRDDIASEALGARFLGRPVVIDVRNAPESAPGYRALARIRGTAPAAELVAGFDLPLGDFLTGDFAYSGELRFPRGKQESPPPFQVVLDTDLAGLESRLPAPLAKAADAKLPVSATIEFPRGEDRIETSGTVGNLLAWTLGYLRDQSDWDFDRGVLAFGSGSTAAELIAADTRGLHLRGAIESFRLQDWFDLSRADEKQAGAADRIRSIDVVVGHLRILGQHLVDHRVRVDRSARDWLVQLDGADVIGSAFVPYDLDSGRAVVLDMERLVLPGDETSQGARRVDLDPRKVPPISIKAGEFALGERFFGSVDTEIERTADGLIAETLVTRDATFEIIGSGRWLVDASDPMGSRTSVTGTLTSTNIDETMRRLAYGPGIVGNDMALLFDVSWSGGPRHDFLDTLDGEVQVRLGSGQLDEVDPGAGRMFGLMSVVALPRRLALDFRDVFGKGFGFDTITGTFRIEDGDTYTCDLSLVGPAADIGIVGRASLVDRDYEQVAVVNASFGDALPVVGAVVAGPQVAAAMLIFSQIFKKPLQEVSQVYYAVRGSWDEPEIDSASADSFAASGRMAGCFPEDE